MYPFLQNLLEDKFEGELFAMFTLPHLFFIFLIAAVVAAVLLISRKKGIAVLERSTRFLISLAFGLYMADFFLMPFAYGVIDIDKLPFHVCTSMCVMCFLSYHVPALEKFKLSFVLLGLISNVVYVVYPAGIMWSGVTPYCYRAIQTLLFHSVMTMFGILMLVKEFRNFDIMKWYLDLVPIVALTVWALIGNYSYSGDYGDHTHDFNWFFLKYDPLGIFPVSLSPYIMPFVNIAVFFAAEMLIHLVIDKLQKAKKPAQIAQ